MKIIPSLRPMAILIASVLLSGCAAQSPDTQPGAGYLPPGAINIKKVLADPPADNSAAARTELDRLLAIQAKRTPQDVARIMSEPPLSPYLFSSVLGSSFNAQTLPATDALLKRVSADAAAVIDQAKACWNRKRPWVLEARIQPCIAKPTDPSYPSARAARSRVWAVILGQLFPARKSQLLAAADQVAQNRIDAGVHYPTDVEAGKALADAIADKIIQTPAFAADMAAARAELAKVKP